MSNQDNFAGGFLAGAVVGGILGGILGAALVSARSNRAALPEDAKDKKSSLKAPTEKSIEAARRGLEDKIAQLNDAIDDVRQHIGTVNHNGPEEDQERTFARDA
ncbi:MAG: hypothetical protein VKJ46_04300 [Leptolyngbyaceae bacterium]|nr:hypothetical protein [Leptolyngbyaceae bacterium]